MNLSKEREFIPLLIHFIHNTNVKRIEIRNQEILFHSMNK